MEKILVYHNGECSKSVSVTDILKAQKIDFDVRYYMLEPLSEIELKELITKLNVPPETLVRKNESLFQKQFAGKDFSDEEWIQLLVKHPELMQRPIAIKNNKAIIARPPEKIFEIL